jgi:hypothetical protein
MSLLVPIRISRDIRCYGDNSSIATAPAGLRASIRNNACDYLRGKRPIDDSRDRPSHGSPCGPGRRLEPKRLTGVWRQP